MANKEDTEQVVNLTFVPVGTIVEARNARNWRGFVRICLHSNSGIVAYAQKIVDDLESLIPCWKIDGSDIGDLRELSSGIVWNMLIKMT